MVRYSSTYDIIQAGGTSHTYTGGSDGSNEVDGDFNTAHNHEQEKHGGAANYTSTVQGDHDFVKSLTIIAVTFRLKGVSAVDSYSSGNGGYVHLDAWLYYNGAYQSIYNNDVENPTTLDTGTHTITQDWFGVSKFRLKVDVNAHSDNDIVAQAYIYEVQATAIINRSYATVT